jgi:Cof subfamily protein (haloacid dehalogenase superfamily)
VSYRVLALDLDGTLVRRDGGVHDVDLEAIGRLQADGVAVTIVTGRLYSGSREIARLVKLVGPIACVDGSHIVHVDGDREAFHASIRGEHAVRLRAIIERNQAASFLFAQDAIVHDARGDPFASYVRTWSPNVSVVERVTAHPHWEHERGVLAVVAVGAVPAIEAAVKEIEAELAGAALCVSFSIARYSGMAALVVRAAGPTKGTALQWMAEHHNCTVAEIVAVGDWLNDVPMFEVAGRSFVMGQAPEEVKQVATDRLVADILVGGGVAEAIARAWGKR